jgi:hypothetical protein
VSSFLVSTLILSAFLSLALAFLSFSASNFIFLLQNTHIFLVLLAKGLNLEHIEQGDSFFSSFIGAAPFIGVFFGFTFLRSIVQS